MKCDWSCHVMYWDCSYCGGFNAHCLTHKTRKVKCACCMTPEEVSAELKRRNIDTAPIIAAVRKQLEEAKRKRK